MNATAVLHSVFYDAYYVFLLGYLLVVSGLAATVAFVLRRRWTRPGRARTLAARSALSLFSTAYLLLALEGIFAYAVVDSDGFAFTLASRRWYHQYWRPINSYGYRDREPVWQERIAFVVGDSFVAGDGIERIEDRFSDVLGRELGAGWTVANLGGDGWGPLDYLHAVESHDRDPSVIVVSYFVNDIEPAAEKRGFTPPCLRSYPPGWLAPLVYRSSLLDWAYWRAYRADLGEEVQGRYLAQAFSREDVRATHAAELDDLVALGGRDGAVMIFVLWPDLLDVAGSARHTAWVAEHLQSRGATVVDLAQRFADRDGSRLVNNRLDAHPNEAVHAEVGQLLARIIREQPIPRRAPASGVLADGML